MIVQHTNIASFRRPVSPHSHRCLLVATAVAASAAANVRPITHQPRPNDAATGYVNNDACLAKIPAAWHELLAGVSAAYQQACGSSLVGVYLRGSLPRGYFLPHVSDVDTFAVVLADAAASDDKPATATSGNSNAGISSSSSSVGRQAVPSPSRCVSSNSSSSCSGPASLQQHVRELICPLLAQHCHLKFSKVEVKVLQVPAGTAAAAALQQHLAAETAAEYITTLGLIGSSSSKSSSQSSGGGKMQPAAAGQPGTPLPPLNPSMMPSIPCAFELKSQSVCLCGVDLPLLLPPAAALPCTLQLLPGLAEDLEAARQRAAEAEHAADLPQQVSVVRWCLKRLVRAAFELVQQQAGVWTRDLYWCCHFASAHLPQLQQQLQQALELYVALQDTAPQQQQQQQQQPKECNLPQQVLLQRDVAVDGLQQRHDCEQQQKQKEQQQWMAGQQSKLQQQLAAAWQLIDALQSRVETLFLKQMLAEEPGWLTKHIGVPVPAHPSNSNSSRSNRPDAAPSQEQQQQHWPWKALRQQLQGLAAAVAPAAAVASSNSEGFDNEPQWLLGATPPAVQVPVWGSAAECDWRDSKAQAQACAAVKAVLLGEDGQHCCLPNALDVTAAEGTPAAAVQEVAGRCMQHDPALQAELLSCLQQQQQQPLVLRGLGAAWPAVADASWGLGWLSRQGFSGRMRVAPSLQFPFCEPQLVELLQQIAGPSAAPSLEFDMSCAEFVARMQPDCQLPHLAYAPHEHYYMQARLPQHMQQELGLQELLQAIATAGGAAGAAGIAAAAGVDDDGATAERSSEAGIGAGSCACGSAVHAPESGCGAVDGAVVGAVDGAVVGAVDGAAVGAVDGAAVGAGSCVVADGAKGPGLRFSQDPRIWISPAGAVSPLHYDTSHSLLVQVQGYKRMLFFSPDQLYRLYCYPDTHLLRRRSRVNVCDPDCARFPLFRGVGALEVVLGPGDGVFFPSRWAHHTESLGEVCVMSESGSDVACGAGVSSPLGVSSAGAANGSKFSRRGASGCCVSVTFRLAAEG